MNHSIATLFAMVLVGHLVGDFIFQTDHQAANKMKPGFEGWWADVCHVWWYTVAMWVITIWAWIPDALWSSHVRPPWTPWQMWAFLGISAVTHLIIDRRTPVRWLMEHTGSREFSKTPFGMFAYDQTLHISILFITVAALWR